MAKKKGKYVHVIDTLPRLANLEPPQQDKIDNVKDQIYKAGPEPPTLVEDINALLTLFNKVAQGLICCGKGQRWATAFASGYGKVRFAKDAVKEMASQLEIIEEAYEQAGIEQFEVEGAKAIIVPEGTVKHEVEPYAQVEDKEKFRLWCIANGYERSLALPWPKTNSTTKELLHAGLPVPDGVKAFQKHKLKFTSNKELMHPDEEFADYVHPSEREDKGAF